MPEKRVSSSLSNLINSLSLSSTAKRIFSDSFNLFLILLGIIFVISLWTFNPSDQNIFLSKENSNFSNSIGLIGAYLSYYSYMLLGVTAWLLVIPTFWVPIKYLFSERPADSPINFKKLFFSFAGFILFVFSLATIFAIHLEPYKEFFPKTSAGLIGLTIKDFLLPYLAILGSTIVSVFFLLI